MNNWRIGVHTLVFRNQIMELCNWWMEFRIQILELGRMQTGQMMISPCWEKGQILKFIGLKEVLNPFILPPDSIYLWYFFILPSDSVNLWCFIILPPDSVNLWYFIILPPDSVNLWYFKLCLFIMMISKAETNKGKQTDKTITNFTLWSVISYRLY